VVEELLKHSNIDPNGQDSSDFTALIAASYWGHSQAVQVLLSHPKINPNLKNSDGFTALHLAIEKGYIDIIKLFMGDTLDVDACNEILSDPMFTISN
jgi:ankyrin repeat protein